MEPDLLFVHAALHDAAIKAAAGKAWATTRFTNEIVATYLSYMAAQGIRLVEVVT